MFIQKLAPTGDACDPLTRMVTFARAGHVRNSGISVIVAVVMWAASAAAWAGHPGWHGYSESYEVHLGVVPASVADRDHDLRRMHEVAAHGGAERTAALRHIMVAVFRRSGNERVVNADVSAEVIENDLIHVKHQKKNLDIMMLPDGESYCNFFALHWNGRYQIKIRVSEPGKQTEWLIFEQEERDL